MVARGQLLQGMTVLWLHALRNRHATGPNVNFRKLQKRSELPPKCIAECKPFAWPPYPFTSLCRFQTPRHYVVTDSPNRRNRQAEEVYSYSYSSDSSNRSGDPFSRPQVRSSSTAESVSRSSTGGPGGYSYTSERSSRSRGDGPGGYHSSYSSTTSGNLPGGTSYRHWSYRV